MGDFGDFIFKILTLQEFEELDFQSESLWPGTAFDVGDGFIHFSTKSQIKSVANRFFSSHKFIKILKFSIKDIEHPNYLKWEKGEKDSHELFPHLYGGLDLVKCLEKIHWQISID